MGQLWGSAVFVFQCLMNSFLAGVWNALSRICILKCPLKILSAAFSVSSLLPVMWLRIQYCGYGTAAKRPWCKFMGHLQGPHPKPRSVCLWSNAPAGQAPSGPLVFGPGSYSSFKGTFVCGWMPNFCCWEKFQKWQMSYAAMMLTSFFYKSYFKY